MPRAKTEWVSGNVYDVVKSCFLLDQTDGFLTLVSYHSIGAVQYNILLEVISGNGSATSYTINYFDLMTWEWLPTL